MDAKLRPACAPDRAAGALRSELVVWISSVRPDGRPHVVPTWFSWDGDALFVFSKPDAVKVRNIRRRGSVMLAVGDPMADFDVNLIEAEAELLDVPTSRVASPAHYVKYRRWLAEIGLGEVEYAATYSQAIRLVPTRFLGWHGRTPREPALNAALARPVSLRPRTLVARAA